MVGYVLVNEEFLLPDKSYLSENGKYSFDASKKYIYDNISEIFARKEIRMTVQNGDKNYSNYSIYKVEYKDFITKPKGEVLLEGNYKLIEKVSASEIFDEFSKKKKISHYDLMQIIFNSKNKIDNNLVQKIFSWILNADKKDEDICSDLIGKIADTKLLSKQMISEISKLEYCRAYYFSDILNLYSDKIDYKILLNMLTNAIKNKRKQSKTHANSSFRELGGLFDVVVENHSKIIDLQILYLILFTTEEYVKEKEDTKLFDVIISNPLIKENEINKILSHYQEFDKERLEIFCKALLNKPEKISNFIMLCNVLFFTKDLNSVNDFILSENNIDLETLKKIIFNFDLLLNSEYSSLLLNKLFLFNKVLINKNILSQSKDTELPRLKFEDEYLRALTKYFKLDNYSIKKMVMQEIYDNCISSKLQPYFLNQEYSNDCPRKVKICQSIKISKKEKE